MRNGGNENSSNLLRIHFVGVIVYNISYTGWTTNTITCSSGISVLFYCSDKYKLAKVRDYNSNCYNENTKEWKEVQLHLNRLAGEEAKKLLL